MRSTRSSKRPKKPKLFLVRRVLGDSMAPTLVPGTVVLGIRPRKLRAGDIVVVWHEGIDKIKRIKKISLNKVFLMGDNPLKSTDSRDFGWVSLEHILAKVIMPRRPVRPQTELVHD